MTRPPDALGLALLALLLPCSVRAAEESAARPGQAVGEKPTAETADQAFLRDQAVLVARGRQTLELGVAYGRAERDLVAVRAEQVTATVEAAWRLGLADDLQLSARLPWRYQRAGAFAADPALVPPATTEAAFGDMSLGLFGVVLHEGAGRPNVVLTLDGVAPTGPGESGLGAGLSVTRSSDPVILFCGASYLHGFRARPDDLLARHNVGFNAGVAFAMNESVAMTGQLVGTVRNYAAPPGGPRPLREQYRLQLGVTLLVTRRLFIEPVLAVAVGTASPDLTLGINVPWTP